MEGRIGDARYQGRVVAVAGKSVALEICEGVACATLPDGSAVEGGGDAGPDGPVPPPGCDANAEPKDAPKCVVSDFGVFVDATGGADTNPGTKESPKKTIGSALSALGGKPRVYVCEGTYVEQLKVTTGVSFYGGFACGGWTYTGAKPKVAPTNAGFALHIDKVTTAIVIADVALVTGDAHHYSCSPICSLRDGGTAMANACGGGDPCSDNELKTLLE